MSIAGVTSGGAAEQAERITRAASPWIVRLARFGYAAKGVVYVLVGSLTAYGALKGGDGPTDSRGVLESILHRPYGRVLLGVVAAGLASYALWRLVQALMDTEDKGAKLKGLSIRFGYACIGMVYAGLGYSAVQLIFGYGAGKGSDQTSREWTALVFALPLGRLLVGLGGLAVIGFGGWQCYKAFTAKFCEKWKRHEMSERSRSYAMRAGQVGLTARGVVFGIVGIFLIQAALRSRPDEARGLSGALRALAQQWHGPYVLGAVALGLVAYGLYMFVEARYRRMRID